MHTRLYTLLRHRPTQIAAGLAILLLLLLYLWPLVRFHVPLGYDAGMYRYLFLRHAEALPPFAWADLPAWARGHPPGLFFFTSILLRMGMPVDWLLGWIWHIVPVILAVSFAWITSKRFNDLVAVFLLYAVLLSAAYYDGFAAMYWKTYASLFFCIWTLFAAERRSLWAVPLGILTVGTHHQTGLLLGLSLALWVLVQGALGRLSRRVLAWWLLSGIAMAAVGVLLYIPIWDQAVMPHLANLFQRQDVPAGSFPSALFYTRTTAVLLGIGLYGFALSLRREGFSLWHTPVVLSACFVLLRLFFYRRFYLQLDFFLLPFAGIGMADIWEKTARKQLWRIALIAALLIQFSVTLRVTASRHPFIDTATLQQIQELSQFVPADATVLALENQSVVFLRGWLPEQSVGGPGLFDSRWSYEDWEDFLLGSHEDRVRLVQRMEQPVFVFTSPFFFSYYADQATQLLQDPCFVPTEHRSLYRLSCKRP